MYRIIKVEYIEATESMPFDRPGVHATGRILVLESLYDGSIREEYEYEDCWTSEYEEEEILGKNF